MPTQLELYLQQIEEEEEKRQEESTYLYGTEELTTPENNTYQSLVADVTRLLKVGYKLKKF